MRRGRPRPKRTDTTITIPVSSLSVGAQSANAFAGWESPATTVATESGTKVITVADAATMIAKSKGVSRDQEITTNTVGGSIYLRWTPGGKAIRFRYDSGANGIQLQIVDAITDGSGSSTIVYAFTLPDTGSIPGYSNALTNTWTFGVEGVEVYLKFNGTEFFRAVSLHIIDPGHIAIASAGTGYGFTNVTATHRISIPLKSDLTRRVFDLRDFGMKPDVSTTGSVNVGADATAWTFASVAGFSVGAEVCIATGGEAGGGVPGERGVGGQWPSLLYATTGARDSDTTQVTNKVCGVLANGNTYLWTGSAWVPYAASMPGYLKKIVPRALVAKITAIVGTTVTLDTAATVSVTNANIYLSNAPFLSKINGASSGVSLHTAPTFYISGGTWVFAGQHVVFSEIPDVRVIGPGRELVTILSPTGIAETGVVIALCGAYFFGGIGFRGNCRADKGYMFRYDATTDLYVRSCTFITASGCSNGVTDGVKSVNHSGAASLFDISSNCVQRNIEIIHETGHKNYIQWGVNIADSVDCITEDITVDYPYLMGGVESFRSVGSILRRATGRNALMSSNSNSDLLFQDCSMVYEEGAGNAPWNEGLPGNQKYPSSGEPLLNLNSNIDNTSGSNTGTGLTVENCDFDVQGRLWDGGGITVIAISGTTDDITIRGKYPEKPVSSPSGVATLPDLGSDKVRFVGNDAVKTILIDGVRVKGDYTDTPIGTFSGPVQTGTTIRNSVLDNQSAGGTQTANITNAAYEAL